MRDCASPDARLSLSLPLSLSLSLFFSPSLSLSLGGSGSLSVLSLSLWLPPFPLFLSFSLSLRTCEKPQHSSLHGTSHTRCHVKILEPHSGARPSHLKSICHTQSTFGPYAVQTWSRYARNFEPKKTSCSTEWRGGSLEGARESSRQEGRVLRRLFRAHNLAPAFASTPTFPCALNLACALQRGRWGVLHAVRVCGGEGVVRISV